MFASQQQQPAQTGTGLFGNPAPQQTNSAPSIFGNIAAQPAQNTLAPPSLFGNTNTGNTNPTSTQTTGGLFGAPPTQGNTGTNPLFGGSMAQQGGGLFGNPTANQPNAPTTTGSLFAQQQQQQQQPTGNIFGGGTAAPNAGNSLFGTKPAGSLFGSVNTGVGNAPNPLSLFTGMQPQNTTLQVPQIQQGLFSQPSQQQNQQQQRPLFGTSLNQSSGGIFGGSSSSLGASSTQSNLFSSRSTALPAHQHDVQTQFAALTQRIEGVVQSWNANSPLCRFQHYFYNLVDPNQVSLYARPPNATNDTLWEKAVRENPDPTRFVPVPAIGFDDLQQRINAQSQQAAAHQEKLKELQNRISALTQQHEVSNAPRMQRAMAQQAQLAHRVLTLVQHLHLLIPALRSSAIRPEEEALRAALEEIDEEMRKPGGGGGRMRGKLNELWALVGAVHAAKERGRKGTGGGPGAGVDASVEWAVVDEEGLGQIAQILSEQQAGLSYLTKILQRDQKDLSIIQGNGSPGQDDDHSNVFRSVGSLRGSTMR